MDANAENVLSSWTAEAAAQERMANELSQNALGDGPTNAKALLDALGRLPYPRQTNLENRTLSLLPLKSPSRAVGSPERRAGATNHASKHRRELTHALLSLFEEEVGNSVLLATDEIVLLEKYLIPLVRNGDPFPSIPCDRFRKNLADQLAACEDRAFKTALPWRAYFSVLGAIAKHAPSPETGAREYKVWRRWEETVDRGDDVARRYLDLYRRSHEPS